MYTYRSLLSTYNSRVPNICRCRSLLYMYRDRSLLSMYKSLLNTYFSLLSTYNSTWNVLNICRYRSILYIYRDRSLSSIFTGLFCIHTGLFRVHTLQVCPASVQKSLTHIRKRASHISAKVPHTYPQKSPTHIRKRASHISTKELCISEWERLRLWVFPPQYIFKYSWTQIEKRLASRLRRARNALLGTPLLIVDFQQIYEFSISRNSTFQRTIQFERTRLE